MIEKTFQGIKIFEKYFAFSKWQLKAIFFYLDKDCRKNKNPFRIDKSGELWQKALIRVVWQLVSEFFFFKHIVHHILFFHVPFT